MCTTAPLCTTATGQIKDLAYAKKKKKKKITDKLDT